MAYNYKKRCIFATDYLTSTITEKTKVKMKKFVVTMMIGFSALLLMGSCSVPQGKLTEHVQKAIVEEEQKQGNTLEVTELNLGEKTGKDYKGVLKGKLNGEDVVYEVSVVDEGGEYDVDWELRK